MSARRRGATGLSGIILVDKPAGLTSHDVVARARRATGEGRVGHAGTLDPMATGLLVVLVGPATRLEPYLSSATKGYSATIVFGTETDTDDAEGSVTRSADPPIDVLDPASAATSVAGLVGSHEQLPPAYSAIKRDGVTAHKAARRGAPLTLEPRAVHILSADLAGVAADPPSWQLDLVVSKGTYVRAIARDLGRALGSAAHLGALRRTRSGALDVASAHPIARIDSAADPCEVAELFSDPVGALELPVVEVTEEGALRVSTGSALDPAAHCGGACPASGEVAIQRDGVLLGVYVRAGEVLRAQTIIPGGVWGGER